MVNEYDLEKDTKITDYGDYTEVTNLSSEDKITENGNEYTVEGRKGKFYYQGNLESKALPWEISISYYLDGEKISADAISVPIWNPMKKARTEEPSREMQKEL